ncbi:MAG: 4Fe-4S binding protein [Actinomycetota bacterium]|nr:4Fe-4S binding protein [Actinomycetota bacterium]
MKEICIEQAKRKSIQSHAWLLLPLIVFGGLKWPYLGFGVLAMMGFFLVMAAIKGRHWCGWFCPRGSFLERILERVSLNGRVPALLKTAPFRWSVFALMMSFMSFRLIGTGGNPVKIGSVFITMCIITSILAIGLGLIFKPRSWCSFCPMGTLQGVLGASKNLVSIGEDCIDCGACGRVCPIGTVAMDFKDSGRVASIDCLRCRECLAKCPVGALDC